MKKSILFFAALAALFSCSKENPVDNYNPADDTYSVTLTASAPGADTKTTLVDGEGTKFVHWSKGDAIKVLFFPNHKDDHTIVGPSGVFTSDFKTDISSEANFRTDSWSWCGTYTNDNDARKTRLMEVGIAVYPHTAEARSEKNIEASNAKCESEISFVLPSKQEAIEGNIKPGLNFSYANVDRDSFINTVDKGTRTELKFNNACALIELTMPSTLDKQVTSISIASNDNVPLTGKGVATLSYYKTEVDSNPNINDGVDHIFKPEISEGAGVILNNANGFEANVKYYAVVWPGKHESGLTIEFTAEDGTKATKTTGKVELKASLVKPYSFSKGLVFESNTYDYVYSDGTFGNDPKPTGKTVVGVIFFNGNPRENDSALPEYCTHGLAISLAPTSTKWQGSTKFPNTNFQNHGLNNTSGSVWGYSAMLKWKELYSSDYLQIYNTDYGTLPAGKTSGWYHGTNCEWNMIAKSADEINEKLTAAGKTTLSLSYNNYYWTAVGSSATYMYCVKSFGSSGATYGTQSGLYAYPARPIFAF